MAARFEPGVNIFAKMAKCIPVDADVLYIRPASRAPIPPVSSRWTCNRIPIPHPFTWRKVKAIEAPALQK